MPAMQAGLSRDNPLFGLDRPVALAQAVALAHQIYNPPFQGRHPLIALGEVCFELAQTADVGPVRLADEVREHVHLAEDLLHQCPVGRGWVIAAQ